MSSPRTACAAALSGPRTRLLLLCALLLVELVWINTRHEAPQPNLDAGFEKCLLASSEYILQLGAWACGLFVRDIAVRDPGGLSTGYGDCSSRTSSTSRNWPWSVRKTFSSIQARLLGCRGNLALYPVHRDLPLYIPQRTLVPVGLFALASRNSGDMTAQCRAYQRVGRRRW
jgi:hypothetical protein